VFQNWPIPSSDRGRERPSGARKYVVVSFLRKITNILDFFSPKEAILQKISFPLLFSTIIYTIINKKTLNFSACI
jgi:hypothetical protein